MKFLDPACGCGNFLIIAYRELRLLEIELLKCLFKRKRQYKVGAEFTSTIRLDSFYGIELEEFPAQIAETAMWLMEHKMNLKMNEELSGDVNTLPLKKSATIYIGNALHINWNEIISNQQISYILANPPFISKKERDAKQVEDMKIVTKESSSVLDYVCAWYIKASEYIQGTNIKCAFVSTNSIVQGEQVSELWRFLIPKNIYINFAHRTFKWSNELKGDDSASVYCVIIGFANYSEPVKRIYHYEKPNTPDPQIIIAKNINPYLIDFENIIVEDRRNALFNAPKIYFGNMPNDDYGEYLFTEKEYLDFISENPKSKELFKQFISNKEFLYGKKMWCLWLKDIEPSLYKNIPAVMERVQAVSRKRTASKREATNKIPPYLFGEIRQQLIKETYLLIPRHTSENRVYVPFAFFNKNQIVGDTCLFIPDATLYDFGILTSIMHMAWMRVVCGRLESRYRYSNTLVYNNFPFSENVSDELKKQVSEKAKEVLDIRKKYPNSTPDDLYDPDVMPDDLAKAHNELDRAVDKCYGKTKFENELERVKFLFALYKAKVEPLNFVEEKKQRKSRAVS